MIIEPAILKEDEDPVHPVAPGRRDTDPESDQSDFDETGHLSIEEYRSKYSSLKRDYMNNQQQLLRSGQSLTQGQIGSAEQIAQYKGLMEEQERLQQRALQLKDTIRLTEEHRQEFAHNAEVIETILSRDCCLDRSTRLKTSAQHLTTFREPGSSCTITP